MTNSESRTASTAHTPGPWESSTGPYIVTDTGEGETFSGGDWSIFPPTGEVGPVAIVNGKENARLIAAAPDLLAVARMAEQCAKMEIGIERAPDFSPDDMLRAAQAAIAKAAGDRESDATGQRQPEPIHVAKGA